MAAVAEQVPGIQRRKFGDIVVTALNDGYIILPVEAVNGISAQETEALYRSAGRRPPYATAINAYLVETPDHKVLVDAGSGGFMGPSLGKLPRNLRAAGLKPDEIDHVVITHMHPDHVGGLLADDGEREYRNARIMISDRELAYWTDRSNRPSSPPSTRESFDIAARIASVYAGSLETFSGTADIVPGIRAEPLHGHTPGHTGYAIGRERAELLIGGDLAHAPELQFKQPGLTVIFDVDPPGAEASRRAILERAIREDLLVAGMHIPFPGFIRVARSGQGFEFHPQVFQYDLVE
jgi:glyoxylase-like metal-dependent hydrolase (beta-lactamase superfamily II)